MDLVLLPGNILNVSIHIVLHLLEVCMVKPSKEMSREAILSGGRGHLLKPFGGDREERRQGGRGRHVRGLVQANIEVRRPPESYVFWVIFLLKGVKLLRVLSLGSDDIGIRGLVRVFDGRLGGLPSLP